MQWAQRSHECPMCFKNLELEDEDMNALLPFGEYTPAHATVASSADDSWDLERLLIRLASANHRHERRAARRAARHAAAAASQRQAAVPAAHQPSPAIAMPMAGSREAEEATYPASWPPAGRYDRAGGEPSTPGRAPEGPRTPLTARNDGEGSSGSASSMSLKSRFAKLNFKYEVGRPWYVCELGKSRRFESFGE